ncbi:MAG: proline iminopeptidase-family hydrolase [Chloroflexi bacterium]|nr:proline iminopeptidase-family hydrolase [Chloroflexota bacterium]
MVKITEGRIPFKGYSTWYRIAGEGEEPGKLPLLALHGGPGASYDYLESLDAMAATGRRVIYYDQLGCGNSAISEKKPEMWTVQLYVEEIDNVRRALGLERIHLLGQSWGGMLSMEYMLTQPKGIASLTIASSPASMIQWVAEANRLRKALPSEVEATLEKHEQAATTDHPDYVAATQVFYDRHLCRVNPAPDYFKRSFEKMAANPEVYNTMNGPNEFHVIGTLKTWDIIDRLPEINAPTLVTSGKYDEATPLIAGTVYCGIPGARWVVFDNSAHTAHIEEAERYMQVLSAWLAENE